MRAQTLPGPYKNRFEANSGCESPLGLYNCPQQRTSQAFSSLDDLDGLAGLMGPPQVRKSTEATSHYPSLERSAKKKQKPGMNHTGAMSAVNMQHLQAQQHHLQDPSKPDSRSMENLELLENAGARGSVRPRNRMSQGGPPTNQETLAAREKALDDLVYRTGQTTLKNNEEYPPPQTSSSSSAAGGFDDVDGSYPALPLPARRTTLLPGQTYPEPVSAAHTNLLTHAASHHASAVTTLRDALSPPRVVTNYNHTFTVHARKVETTFGLNDSVRTHSVINNDSHESPTLPQRHNHGGEDVKPPLFPKQYYNSVKHRQHGSPMTEHNESPAVPRKLKPSLSTASATLNFNHSVMNSPGGSGVASDLNNSSFDTTETNLSHSSGSGHAVSGYVPYRETSKPFEMADFYKYSTKFRKASASSLRSADSDSPKLGGSESPRSAGSGSQRSSTSRDSVPPELPTKPSSLAGGHPMPGSTNSGTVSAVPAVARMPGRAGAGDDEESLADAFSSEMLAWYEQKQSTKPNPNSGKPATLV